MELRQKQEKAENKNKMQTENLIFYNKIMKVGISGVFLIFL